MMFRGKAIELIMMLISLSIIVATGTPSESSIATGISEKTLERSDEISSQVVSDFSRSFTPGIGSKISDKRYIYRIGRNAPNKDESEINTAKSVESELDSSQKDESEINTAFKSVKSELDSSQKDEKEINTAKSIKSELDSSQNDKSEINTAKSVKPELDSSQEDESEIKTVEYLKSKAGSSSRDESKSDAVKYLKEEGLASKGNAETGISHLDRKTIFSAIDNSDAISAMIENDCNGEREREEEIGDENDIEINPEILGPDPTFWEIITSPWVTNLIPTLNFLYQR